MLGKANNISNSILNKIKHDFRPLDEKINELKENPDNL
jgi:hypothetical protein